MTCARAAVVAIGVFATCGCVLFATGCGRSPTAPDGGGTYLRFAVTDRVNRPLAGALVAVLDGPLAGTTKLTDDAGRFELTGTAVGTVTTRVSRDGFQTRTQALSWDPQPRPFYPPFWLDAVEPPIGLDPGDYTLTIAIDLTTARNNGNAKAPCAGFPVELTSRRYRATIREESSPMSAYNRLVNSDDPTLPWHNMFAHTLFVFGVVGRFVGFGEWDEPIFEELPGFRHVRILISGTGTAPTTEAATTDGSSVSISFSATFEYRQTKSFTSRDCWHERAEEIVDYHSCSSDHATMVFTKR